MATSPRIFPGLTIPPAQSLNNTAARDRIISASADRALVPLTYGEDRIGALIANVLPAGTDGQGDLLTDPSLALWLKFDGVDGGTTFVDSSVSAKSITRIGAAVTSTEQARFGPSSLKGGAGLGLAVPYAADLELRGAEWRIKGWSYNTATSGFGALVDFRGTGAFNVSWVLFFNYADRNLNLYDGPSANTVLFTNTNTTPLNEWFLWEVVRTGTVVTMYINTVARASVVYNPPATHSSGVRIGINQAGADPMIGYLDELQIRRGNAPPPTGNTLLVQCLWGYALDSIQDVQLNGLALPAGATVTHYTGDQTTPDAALVAAFAAQDIPYTSTLAGYAYSVVAMPTRAFDGQLNITARLRGRRVYDPRKDSTAGGSGAHRLNDPATWEWSDNPALADADFLASATYGPGVAVDWASVPAAANANDALVGTERRRTLGVSFIAPASALDMAETLRAYASCWHVPSPAGVRLVPDADGAPVATYSHAAGQIAAIQPLLLADLGNSPTAVEVIFTDTSVTPWRDGSAVATVPGAGTTLPWRISIVRMPGVRRYSQAMREAIERLNKLRLGSISTTVDLFDEGIRHDVGDIIALTHPMGLSAQPMRVQTSTMTGPGRWRLDVTEHDAGAYSDSVATRSAAVLPSFVSPAGPPGAVTGFAVLAARADGTLLGWTDAPESDVTGYELRIGGTTWATATPIDGGVLPTIVGATRYLWVQPAAGTYTLRIKALDSEGNASTGEGSPITATVDATTLSGIAPGANATSIDANGLIQGVAQGAGTPVANTLLVPSINAALATAAAAQATADGKIDTFWQASAPGGAAEGDLWFDTDDGLRQYRFTGGSWVVAADARIGTAINNAATAQATADGKVRTFVGASAPTAEAVGDLWIDTGNGNRINRWSGGAWVQVPVGTGGLAPGAATQVDELLAADVEVTGQGGTGPQGYLVPARWTPITFITFTASFTGQAVLHLSMQAEYRGAGSIGVGELWCSLEINIDFNNDGVVDFGGAAEEKVLEDFQRTPSASAGSVARSVALARVLPRAVVAGTTYTWPVYGQKLEGSVFVRRFYARVEQIKR